MCKPLSVGAAPVDTHTGGISACLDMKPMPPRRGAGAIS